MSALDPRTSVPEGAPPAASGPLDRGDHEAPADPGTPRGGASGVAKGSAKGSAKGRLLWFVGIYGVSLAVFTALVYSLRALVPG